MVDFDKSMKKLLAVNGYLGSALLNYSGEVLYVDNESTGIDITYSASTFNNTFRVLSEASLEVGFSTASFVEVKTYDGHVLLINSAGEFNDDDFSKLNIFAVFRDNGNIGLAKMMMMRVAARLSQKMERL